MFEFHRLLAEMEPFVTAMLISWENRGFGTPQTWGFFLVLPLTSCVTLNESVKAVEPQVAL